MAKRLTIGKYSVPYPRFRGGMGVRISGYQIGRPCCPQRRHWGDCNPGLALGSDTATGVNYFADDRQALLDELRKAYEIAPNGVIEVIVWWR